MAFWERRSKADDHARTSETTAASDAQPDRLAERGVSIIAMERPAETERYRSYIDAVQGPVVVGWCCDMDNPNEALLVEALASNSKRVVAAANLFRQDVKDAGIGNGNHGFRIDLAPLHLKDETVVIRFLQSKMMITKTPISLDPQLAALSDSMPPPLTGLMQQLATELRLKHAEMQAGSATPVETALPVPRRLAGNIGPTPCAKNAPPIILSAPVDAMFDIANPTDDPEGLITKFVAYESYRIKREQHAFDMVGTLQERLSVLLWYLTDYVRDRQGAYLVPLSARQMAYLNSPAPIAGAPPTVTVALYNFVARELPSHLNLLDPSVLREALYWWCIERAPCSAFEDRLVTEEQIAALRDEEQWIGEAYPFNAFMSIFFNRHAELHSLDMNSARDRAVYFHYLLMYGFNQPHIMRFLSKETIRQTLRKEYNGTPILDCLLTHLVLADDTSTIDGHHLRTMGTQILERAGWRLGQEFRPRPSRNTGETFVRRRHLDEPVEPGVALIGPIRKTSGLGQATRLSHDILRQIDRKPTVLSFDLDNPAPVGFGSDVHAQPYRRRRDINLIHLNAESVPLAFAFEQREIFTASYNIGYFFWELNAIPKCHMLALELLDEIWVSSDYNREIYSRYTSKPVINVGMAVEELPAVEALDREALGLDPDSVVFLATFDSFSFIERKNPLGILKAFREAFPLGTENVQLVLKTQNRERVFDPYQVCLWKRIDLAIRKDPRIVIVNETYKYRDLLGLKLACDGYISLHRSEGWGFGMIEAMQLGRPVIATAYSGNMEFCNDETAYLVDYDLISVREEEYIFVERGSQWAQPRISTAAAHMRTIVADRQGAKAKGEAAKAYVREAFSLDAIGRRYAARLNDIESRRDVHFDRNARSDVDMVAASTYAPSISATSFAAA